VTPSASGQPAIIAFQANLTAPVGASSVGSLVAALAATLAGMRCDYAAVAGVPLASVRLSGGVQLDPNATAAELASAIASANTAAACAPAVRRALEGEAAAAAAGGRALQGASAASAAWATIAVNVGAGTSQAGAATIAAALLAAPTTAFPRTTAAWAPFWGYTAQGWLAALGSPLTLIASSLTTLNAASFSPVPVPFVLSSSQQLGLGLGIGIPLGLIVAAAAILAAYMCARQPSAVAPHLLVQEQKKAAPAAAAAAV
jgi:hypothetical protein